MTVRSSELDSQWNALAITDQVAFAARLAPVRRVRSTLCACEDRPFRAAVDDDLSPFNPAITRQPIQQNKVHLPPDPGCLPVAKAPPTGHT